MKRNGAPELLCRILTRRQNHPYSCDKRWHLSSVPKRERKLKLNSCM